MPRDDDDDLPKKKLSYSERDKLLRARKTSGGRVTQDDRERDRFQKSTQYTRYKQGLERLFARGEMAEGVAAQLDPTGEKRDRDEALKKVRLAADDRKKWIAAADEYLAKFPLPDDAYFLDQLLAHPKGAVVEQALAHLEKLAEAGTLKPPASLKARLQSLEIEAGDPDVAARAKALYAKIR